MNTPEELRTEIEAAFAGQVYPGDGAFPESLTGYSWCDERETVGREAASEAWKQDFAEIVAGLNLSQRRVVTKVLRYLDDANRQRQYTAPEFRGALEFWSPLTQGDEPNATNGKPTP